MSDVRETIYNLLADRYGDKRTGWTGIVTGDTVNIDLNANTADAILAAIAEALTSETVIRRGTYVLADYIAGAPIEEHLTRVVNSMLREAGITKGDGDDTT